MSRKHWYTVQPSSSNLQIHIYWKHFCLHEMVQCCRQTRFTKCQHESPLLAPTSHEIHGLNETVLILQSQILLKSHFPESQCRFPDTEKLRQMQLCFPVHHVYVIFTGVTGKLSSWIGCTSQDYVYSYFCNIQIMQKCGLPSIKSLIIKVELQWAERVSQMHSLSKRVFYW